MIRMAKTISARCCLELYNARLCCGLFEEMKYSVHG